MGLVYSPTWMVDFYGKWLGKYTIAPWILWASMGYKVKSMGVSSPHSQPIQVPGFGQGSLRDCKMGGGPKREGIFDEWPGKKKHR